MRIAVSGATGVLGGHIIDELARHDLAIVALMNGLGSEDLISHEGDSQGLEARQLDQKRLCSVRVPNVFGKLGLDPLNKPPGRRATVKFRQRT